MSVVDFIRDLAALTELPVTRLIGWAGLPKGKFYDWKQRYGKVNGQSGYSIPTAGRGNLEVAEHDTTPSSLATTG